VKINKLLEYSRHIKAESSRIGKVQLIKEYLRELEKNEAYCGVHYITGKVAQGKMNLAWKGLSELLTLPMNADDPPSLSEIHTTMSQVAQARGAKKYLLLRAVFERMTKEERRYFLSLIYGETQQGAGEGLVKLAIAEYSGLNDEEMEQAYLRNPDIGELFTTLIAKGKTAIKHMGINLFRPVKPMLAQVSESIEKAFEEIGDAVVEYKLDGVRIQIHKDKEEVKIYSRNLKNRTIHFPELVKIVRSLPAERLILDGEAVSLDSRGRVVPFQVLARRTTRKKDIEEMTKDIPVVPQFFDILYVDKDDLTMLPYSERFKILNDIVDNDAYRTSRTLPINAQRAQAFFRESVDAGNEGVMIKDLNSPYHPGSRGKYWFKVKHSYTIDCVILAAEWGYGRRDGWLSNIHLGVLDETRTRFLMVGKTFKGLTDKRLQWMTTTLPHYKVHEDKWTVYVRPVIVVEIAFNGVQKSPRYDSGFSLRFARVKRFREDKDARDINTIVDLHVLQKKV
jgi:DNA ligase-1